MTNNLLSLLKTDFLNRFRLGTIRNERNKKVKYRYIAMGVLYIFLAIVLAGYCFGISYGYSYLGMSYVVPGYALMITSIIILFFTFLKTNGILFSARDYDMLTAFPIKTRTIIASKFLSMYINNLAFAVVVMVPMAVGYEMWNGFNAGTVAFWFLGILFAPLLPMTIAAAVGMAILAIGAGFKHKAAVQLIATVILFLGIMFGSFWLNQNAMADEAMMLAMLTDMGAFISGIIHKVYPVSLWFDNGVVYGNAQHILLFIGFSVAVYAVFLGFCAKFYGKINSALKSHQASSNYKVGQLKKSSVLTALAYKEAKRFTSSSVYMLNMGMGLILALIASVASAFLGVDKLISNVDVVNAKDMAALLPVISNVVPFGIAMVVNMCNTCAVSLSLEGRNLWVVESLPISKRTLYKGKMLFNICMVLPVSIICSVIFIISLRVNVVKALLYIVFAVASVTFSTVFGMFINICFPNYQWENEVVVVKQGMSSMIGIFSSIIIYLAMAAGTFYLSGNLGGELSILMFSGILAVLAAVLYGRCK